jgi:tripartite-type tricarboxylate transporter receptor subunit TctC
MWNFNRRTALAALGALTLGTGPALAQDYPTRPITIIVPFAAGGPTDVVTRLVAEPMSKTLGQPIIIENVVGAGGTTGATRAARAANDGYTFIMGHVGTHAASVALYPKLAYDPRTDFEPIMLVNGAAIVVAAKKDLPPKDFKEFVAYLKANETKLNQAHAGVGAVSYITCELLNGIIGIKPVGVPFQGTGPAMNALVGGQVDYMCDQITNVVPQVNGGTIKAYAVATPERSPSLPNLPTSAEGGLPNYQASAWNALFAPKGTPKAIVDKLNEVTHGAMDTPAIKSRMLEIGVIGIAPERRSPEYLARFVAEEVARWEGPIKAGGMQVD